MDIYNSILKTNQNHKYRQAISMTLASGEVRKYTYEVLFDEADTYARKLIDAGITRGDRVILVAENSPAWQIAFLAIMQVQATAVLIDPTLPEDALAECIQKADARCIFTSSTVKEKLGDGTVYRVPMFNLSKDGQVFPDSYQVLSPFIPVTEDPMPGIAVIFFNMDKFQRVQGIMYTHEAMIKQVKLGARENELSRNERILSIIPNSQIEGMVSGVLATMLVGASIHYVETLDYESLNRAFKGFKPTIFPAPRAILKQLKEKLVAQLEGQRFDQNYLIHCEKVRKKTGVKLGSIMFKQLLNEFGGKLELIWAYGPIEEDVMNFYYALGLDLLLHYGCVETNIPVLGNRDNDLTLDTCGRPYPEMEVKLMHPNERGEGEMYVKAPYGMAGYFRDSLTYEKTFDQGWFKTGTMAQLTHDGYVKVLDLERSKEGEKVETAENEHYIKETEGLSNKTNGAYYWFSTWKKTAQCLYDIHTQHEEYLPEEGGCIIYSPLETSKGYLGLTVGYSKERFFKFGCLTDEAPKEKFKLEDEAFGKIHFAGQHIDEETKKLCMTQLEKGWILIIKAPKDAINATLTDEVIELAKAANVPIIPAYLEGEQAVFSGKEDAPKLFNMPAYKRYSLALRYGKPIYVAAENHMIKRWIQERFVALIEDHPEEVSEEPLDEITQMALEMLVAKEQTVDISKNTELQMPLPPVIEARKQSVDLECDIEGNEEGQPIDLQSLLATDEIIETSEEESVYKEEITFETTCLSHKSEQEI